MMNIRMLTGIVVAMSALLLIIYDVYAYIVGGTEGTISHVVMSWGYDHPLLPFGCGVLVGHFWWRIKKPPVLESQDNARKELSKNRI